MGRTSVMYTNCCSIFHMDYVNVLEPNVLDFIRIKFKTDFDCVAPNGIPKRAIFYNNVIRRMIFGIVATGFDCNTIIFCMSKNSIHNHISTTENIYPIITSIFTNNSDVLHKNVRWMEKSKLPRSAIMQNNVLNLNIFTVLEMQELVFGFFSIIRSIKNTPAFNSNIFGSLTE